MGQDEPLPFLLGPDWLHHAAAFLCPIAGILVYVTRPQAAGAMVRIAVPLHLKAAGSAGEVLYCARKSPFHALKYSKNQTLVIP